MENYVKTSLRGNKKNKGRKKRGKAPGFNQLAAESEGQDDQEAPRLKTRKNSYIRGGTGRYAEDLGDCIATEKGLLKRDGF